MFSKLNNVGSSLLDKTKNLRIGDKDKDKDSKEKENAKEKEKEELEAKISQLEVTTREGRVRNTYMHTWNTIVKYLHSHYHL